MSILIHNGHIMTTTNNYFTNILIEKKQIVQIGTNLSTIKTSITKIIDTTDQLLFPNNIDAHTHFDIPFKNTMSTNDFDNNTKTTAHNKTTTIIDFTIQTKNKSTLKKLNT